MRHLILIAIVLLFIFILSDDKQLVQGVINKLYKNRSVQLLLLLIMFYLVYNNYPLTYTIPFASIFFLALCGPKLNFNRLFNKKIKRMVEGFEGLTKMFEIDDDKNNDEDDEDDEEYEEEMMNEDEDDDMASETEEDRTKRLDKLLDQMDEHYEILEEAHKINK